MKTIYKYPVAKAVEMDRYAPILHVGMQNGEFVLWAQVDTEHEKAVRSFEVFGTGHELTEQRGTALFHLATLQMASGLVWHVFERCKRF
jgi:hypothetical protein